MALTPSTTSTLTEYLPTGVREAILENVNKANLTDYITLSYNKSGMLFPVNPELVYATSTAEGAAYDIGAHTTTGPTIKPIKYGGGIIITKEMVAQGGEQCIVDASRQLSRMIRAQKNVAIWALFDGFVTNTVGTTNTDITEQNVLDGIALLRAAGAPEPYTLAVTPHVMEDLVGLYKSSTSVVAFGKREEIDATGTITRLFGANVVEIGDLFPGTSAGQRNADDAKCGLFSKEAIGGIIAEDLSLEIDWSNTTQSWTLTGTTYAGFAEIKDEWGVEVLVDNLD
ncbi:MAG: phage major capsid protein [Candidatus Heimdallarchaeaceae archaeon]